MGIAKIPGIQQLRERGARIDGMAQWHTLHSHTHQRAAYTSARCSFISSSLGSREGPPLGVDGLNASYKHFIMSIGVTIRLPHQDTLAATQPLAHVDVRRPQPFHDLTQALRWFRVLAKHDLDQHVEEYRQCPLIRHTAVGARIGVPVLVRRPEMDAIG
ncbi:MAG: hypothetical protein M3R24_42115 [Chloroflexota bacterium]|nr:hypothetical protein [Chloroflexota bacterium]